MKVKLIFHYISYLQYPIMFIAIFFAIKPFLYGLEDKKEMLNLIITNFNNVLIFMGLGISFSTLQDTTKTQNEFSKRVWENPTKGKVMISFMSIMAFFFIILGLVGYFSSQENTLKELSIGIIILGIGFIGLIKTALDMFENHRIDKQ